MKTTTNLFVVATAEKTHRIYIYFFPSLLFILRGFWRHITERRGRGDRDSRYKVHPKLVVLSPAIVIFFCSRILKATTRCFWVGKWMWGRRFCLGWYSVYGKQRPCGFWVVGELVGRGRWIGNKEQGCQTVSLFKNALSDYFSLQQQNATCSGGS